jgi:hypothetical protein
MSSTLRRLLVEEEGTCMTDSRGMYGWVAALGVTAYFLYGHRFPELLAFIDKALPASNAYHVP